MKPGVVRDGADAGHRRHVIEENLSLEVVALVLHDASEVAPATRCRCLGRTG
jgi:hypothetical protein